MVHYSGISVILKNFFEAKKLYTCSFETTVKVSWEKRLKIITVQILSFEYKECLVSQIVSSYRRIFLIKSDNYITDVYFLVASDLL